MQLQDKNQKIQNDIVELVTQWQTNPYRYCLEALGVQPTHQQRDLLLRVGRLVAAKIKRWKDPDNLTKEEAELARKIGISVMSGKGCHAKGTKILLYNGQIKAVEDIQVGDVLIGDDSTPRLVTSLARGTEKFYRLQFAGGEYYDVNENHILTLRCTKTRHKQHIRGTVIDVTVKDYLTWPQWQKNLYAMFRKPVTHWQTNPQNQPISPYLLGVWLGGGHTDSETAAEISKLSPYKNKQIPQSYLIASEQDRLELLAGLIDTGGRIYRYKSKIQYSITQKSRQLAEQIQFLARSLGFHCTLSPQIKAQRYRLNISRGDLSKLPCRCPRKQAPKTVYEDLNFTFTVTPITAQPFYGFSLTGNGRFLGADFTVLHNTGKDAALAWCVLWFLTCFHNSKIPMTGPSRDQMRTVLMAEIAKWANRLDRDGNPYFIFHDHIVIQADTIFMKNADSPNEEGKSWFARLRTAPKGSKDEIQSKAMDGLHEDFMMIAVDEADGVPQPILTSLETTLTGPVNFILIIFNPTKCHGYAYDTHFGNQALYYEQLHWDARESENVNKEQIEKVLATYGEDSVEYRVNVLGLPPEQTADTLIPKEWLDHSTEKERFDPTPETLRIMGVDPSRQGSDPAGVIIRDGWQIVELLEFTQLDTVELADQLAEIFLDWECDLMFIDCIGNGAGVYDLLRRRFPGKVRGVDVSTKTKDTRKRFARLRDELWWKTREVFERHLISIPPNHRLTKKLINELTIMKRDPLDESGGRIKIESKAKMKSRGLKSPNLAEALMVTMACNDIAFRKPHTHSGPRDKYRIRRKFRPEDERFERNWIVA